MIKKVNNSLLKENFNSNNSKKILNSSNFSDIFNKKIKKEKNVNNNIIQIPTINSLNINYNLSSSDIKFSKHAIKRIEQRNIKLTENDIQNIENAILKAEQKGINSLLIYSKQAAYISSVKNKSIITVIDNDSIQDHIFTNIDGTIII